MLPMTIPASAPACMSVVAFNDGALKVVEAHPAGFVFHDHVELEDGEALIRTSFAGICSTDVAMLNGYKGGVGGDGRGFVLGHEFVGTLWKLGNCETNFVVGDRVVAEINCVPHSAAPAEDKEHHPDRTALGIFGRHGAFSQLVKVPVRNLHRVSDSLNDTTAVFVEPLAAACQVLDRLPHPVKSGDRVAILGAGKLGLLVAQVFDTCTPCVVVVLVKSSDSLPSLREKFQNLTFSVGEDTMEHFDIVVDCTGSPAGFNLALSLTRPRGILCLKTTSPGLTPADLSKLVVNEVSVVGSRCGSFTTALRLLEQGRVNVAPLIAKIFPVSQAVEAIAHAQKRGTLKILLEFPQCGS